MGFPTPMHTSTVQRHYSNHLNISADGVVLTSARRLRIALNVSGVAFSALTLITCLACADCFVKQQKSYHPSRTITVPLRYHSPLTLARGTSSLLVYLTPRISYYLYIFLFLFISAS